MTAARTRTLIGRMEWNGMEWNGMEWNGMERNAHISTLFIVIDGTCGGRHTRLKSEGRSHLYRYADMDN
jgi:hypothetical protein